MTNTLKHNKYVSTLNWFSGHEISTGAYELQKPFGPISGGSEIDPDLNIVIHNKFALTAAELKLEELINVDTALIAVKTENFKIGDIVTQQGWNTSDYINIAPNSTITINSSSSTTYGLVFYDLFQTPISGKTFEFELETTISPQNAEYFRICCDASYTNFAVSFNIAEVYTSEQHNSLDNNISDFKITNNVIPEGISSILVTTERNEPINLMAQSPLELKADENNVLKIEINKDVLKYFAIYENLPIDNDTLQWKDGIVGGTLIAVFPDDYIALEESEKEEEGGEIPGEDTDTEDTPVATLYSNTDDFTQYKIEIDLKINDLYNNISALENRLSLLESANHTT